MSEICNHPSVAVEARAETMNDGSRRIYLQLRCTKCQRLGMFRGFEGIAERLEKPVLTQGDRNLSIPFGFVGSYIGEG